ncbi:hypothetical protein SAMN05192588_1037 [Nonlabens sp. Hel1_33_55]|nr:hypothetical protein SAMN05192588_1037 [Nonlabens sp. Hel1_33_55]
MLDKAFLNLIIVIVVDFAFAKVNSQNLKIAVLT